MKVEEKAIKYALRKYPWNDSSVTTNRHQARELVRDAYGVGHEEGVKFDIFSNRWREKYYDKCVELGEKDAQIKGLVKALEWIADKKSDTSGAHSMRSVLTAKEALQKHKGKS